MTRTRRDLLRTAGLVTATGLIAGCSGGESPATTETTGGGEGADAGDGSGPMVQAHSNSRFGEYLTDGSDRTLYLFTQDTEGASDCYDSCASAWPPLTGENPRAGEAVTATVGTIERRTGAMQVTANGRPLYYFANDDSPGEANGQGVDDVWYVVAPDGSPIESAGGGGGYGGGY